MPHKFTKYWLVLKDYGKQFLVTSSIEIITATNFSAKLQKLQILGKITYKIIWYIK